MSNSIAVGIWNICEPYFYEWNGRWSIDFNTNSQNIKFNSSWDVNKLKYYFDQLLSSFDLLLNSFQLDLHPLWWKVRQWVLWRETWWDHVLVDSIGYFSDGCQFWHFHFRWLCRILPHCWLLGPIRKVPDLRDLFFFAAHHCQNGVNFLRLFRVCLQVI